MLRSEPIVHQVNRGAPGDRYLGSDPPVGPQRPANVSAPVQVEDCAALIRALGNDPIGSNPAELRR
jgi:hypothetical protein